MPATSRVKIRGITLGQPSRLNVVISSILRWERPLGRWRWHPGAARLPLPRDRNQVVERQAPPVGEDGGAGHVACLVAGEPGDDGGDLLRSPETAEWRTRQHL